LQKLKPSQSSQSITESGLVTSGQTDVHPHLERTVRRHLQSRWLQPYHPPTVDAYRQLQQTQVFSGHRPIVLDSGCGTGKSTLQLATQYPRHLVIGADRSHVRLGKSGAGSGPFQSGNCVLLRAELTTLWRLLTNDGHLPERHLILYPNPWPKAGHLSRRWHGHPVFPWLLALGGEIELRCNWEIYALEFAMAIQIATGEAVNVKRHEPVSGISPFEKKYHQRGQALFSVLVPAPVTDTFRSDYLTG
jgi:tRNA G46 methylase TrmB